MLFHPFEIAFCGYSGTGKTTLIAEVVRHLAPRVSIAYYKHGCHRFDIDREGKDSWTVGQAGASTVMISDPEKKALVTRPDSCTPLLERHAFSNHDLLIVEGLKELPLPKLLLVDRERRILDLLSNGRISNVAALVVPDDPVSYAPSSIPVLQRDCTGEIAVFVENLLVSRSFTETPLYGLVLAGGHSSRMGSDKALLEYHDKNQLVHTAALLQQQCREVFVSCREDQAETYRTFGIPLITDTYLGIGPLGGLLSAQRHMPGAAWIVAACDLPFLNETIIRQLSAERNPLRFATAFRNPQSGRLEPLCACYEPKSRNSLILRHSEGDNALAAFLKESRIEELMPYDSGTLRNINDPEDRNNACRS
ncbi:MAG: bifunctional molybdenum cofactor guanylyltransferase MobA/molybdopterin-guanine dinucleotide biosynthesis adaptor protein MobB [Chlorobiaceae bacterium]|nr:bifunctional molybdenum cofactor guanylyltransferase MobA/molybdopterin-guanine dinucleotide biosynthesis adaptor protein MobB [Chlorobiaceae bacterium]NTV17045.1 bifunctional molybdenum cofactor guanylyltransferase MobA/molybdopterin-guanine dinucleotide biosynthesis adaptor protein MobB [Chlorobiaceae bacterium]